MKFASLVTTSNCQRVVK